MIRDARFGNDRHRLEVRYRLAAPTTTFQSGTGFRLLYAEGDALSVQGWADEYGPRCVEHRHALRFKVVDGVQSDEVRCDARCEGATGSSCECSCGGANHRALHGS